MILCRQRHENHFPESLGTLTLLNPLFLDQALYLDDGQSEYGRRYICSIGDSYDA